MSGLRESIKLKHLAERAKLMQGMEVNSSAERMRRESMLRQLYDLERKEISKDIVSQQQIADIKTVIESVGNGDEKLVNFTELKLKLAR